MADVSMRDGALKLFRSDAFAIIILGAIQGLFSTLSLAPFNFPLLAWLAPWPLFYFAFRFRHHAGKLILSGWISALFLCSFAFYWMLHLFQVFAGMSVPASLLVFIPYTFVLNLKAPLFVLLFGLSFRRRFRSWLPPRWFTAGVLGLFTDAFTPQIFPWYWGNLIAGNPYLLQTAEVLGIYGLTFLLFAGSYYLYRLFLISLRAIGRNNHAGLSAPSFFRRPVSLLLHYRGWVIPLFLILFLAGGAARKAQMEHLQKSLPRLRVASIQPNAPLERHGESRVTPRVIYNLIFKIIPDLSARAARKARGKMDLIVLPESAVPYYSTDSSRHNVGRVYVPAFELMVQLLAYNWNAEVFLNEISFVGGKDYLGRYRGIPHNSSVLYSRDGKRRDSYHKRVLLAFGEYIPGVEILKATGLIRLVPGIIRGSRFYPGTTSNTIPYMRENGEHPYQATEPLSPLMFRGKDPREFEKEFPPRTFRPDGYFMPLICYEILSPEHVRSFFDNPPERRPDFIVNITQDGWYGNTIETYQHFELGRIRAVETRRAIVRSTNNGSSGFVDIAGNYAAPLHGPKLTAYDTVDFQIWDVPLNHDGMTLYTRFGNSWMILLLLLYLAPVALRFRRNKRKNSPKST